MLLTAAVSPAQEAEQRLENTEEQIESAREREEVLTTELAALDEQIGVLEARVGGLRGAEVAAEARLAAQEARLQQAIEELREARDRLKVMRARLRRALRNLGDRLVAIYMAGSTDTVGLLLDAEGYSDFLQRNEYLDQIQDQDDALADRVRTLRDAAKRLVAQRLRAKATIQEARDAIAAEEARLENARAALETQQGALESTRGERQAALDQVASRRGQLEDTAAGIREQIQQEIAEATAAAPPTTAPSTTAPATTAPSSSGMVWPLNGILTSGFGYRWGRTHEGIDISVGEGTPIVAAASGTVILMQDEAGSGGYGNYTCVDHGGGLSTCYAHQSSFAISAGASVAQGEVIGYSGNTGNSTGPHLHFEVRQDGVAQDPLGYL